MIIAVPEPYYCYCLHTRGDKQENLLEKFRILQTNYLTFLKCKHGLKL